MNNHFSHKTVWVIGASEGIGKALSILLDKLGADLILSARSAHRLDDLNLDLKKPGLLFPLDVENCHPFQSVAEQVLSNKSVDYIFYFPGYYDPMSIDDLDDNTIRKTVNINFVSVIYLFKIFLPYLKKNKQSQLFVAASLSGYIGLPFSQPYASTKAAVINFVESMKSENPDLNIRLINPGFVKTRLTQKNRFHMPNILTPDEAAQFIVSGVLGKKFEIHFPKKLSFFLKILKMVSYGLYFFMAKKYLIHHDER